MLRYIFLIGNYAETIQISFIGGAMSVRQSAKRIKEGRRIETSITFITGLFFFFKTGIWA